MSTGYTGHAGHGGLQRHSLGDNYPYAVVRYETRGYPEWRAEHLGTGAVGHMRRSYAEAEIDIASLRVRNMMHG